MRRLLAAVLLAAAAAMSGGCYVMQDGSGAWWACEDYATPNGNATGCYPLL